MALKLSWYDDLKAESDMRRMAVVFTKVSIPFSRVDLKESQVNGARLKDAIREHKVEDYMQGYRNGDTFPRIVVHKTPTGYVILSGNQRCEALARLIKEGDIPKAVEIEVYLVDTKDKLLLETIARCANVAHGEGDSKLERIQQAVYCVRRLGMATRDASKAFMVADGTINHHIRAEDQRNRLARAGIEASHVPNSALEPLSRIDYDEPAQLKVATLIAQHAPPAERVRQVVGAIAKQSTAPARLQKIREFEKELSEAAHASNGHHKAAADTKIVSRPRREKLFRLLGQLVNFLNDGNDGEAFANLEQLQISGKADTEKVVELSKQIRYRLGVIVK